MKPERIQRKRTKGWRKPPNTVNVCRPGKWGNHHTVGWCVICGVEHTQQKAVDEYKEDIDLSAIVEIREELRGKNLMCFCRLGTPCHADVLLEVANQ